MLCLLFWGPPPTQSALLPYMCIPEGMTLLQSDPGLPGPDRNTRPVPKMRPAGHIRPATQTHFDE